MFAQEIKNIQATPGELRKFGLLLSLFLALFAGISWWKAGSLYHYLWPSAAAVMLLALILPRMLKIIYIPWMTFAIIAGWIMTRVILSLLFYFVVTPIALILKIFGKDLLNEKIEREKNSYWVKRGRRTILKEDFEKQF